MKKANKEKKDFIIIFLIVLFISILSITNGSMWGDEICRVLNPIKGHFGQTIKDGLLYAQPGYLIFMYLWERITMGTQVEFLIRCSNILFVPIAVYYAYKIVKTKKFNPYVTLLFFIHPMFAYYMDEATPYIVVYALSLAYTYYVFFVKDFNATSNIVKINIVYLIGVFFHFMFGFIIIAYITKCLLDNWKDKKTIGKHIKILLLFSLIYVPLLILYLVNLMHTNTGFSIKNIAYILYAFLGMAGLGLSRNDLRSLNFSSITIFQIVILSCMIVVLCILFYSFIKKSKKIIQEEKSYLICILAYFFVILGVSWVIKFGVWERHCYTIFPLFMVVLLDVLKNIKSKKNIPVIMTYFILLIISSLNIRFNYYYQCDDHKGIYNYVKNYIGDDEIVITNTSPLMYNVKDLLNKNQYMDVGKKKEKDIQKIFQTKENATLILFEKKSSEEFYHLYDNDDNYIVNKDYNSFKIITHKK